MNFNFVFICSILSIICLFIGLIGPVKISHTWRYPFVIIGMVLFIPNIIYLWERW